MFSIIDSLSRTESGGDYNADNGLGYYGRLQFGEARLKDLGLGSTFTMEDFKTNTKVQDMVGNAHIADIDRYIDSTGLTSYLGSKINGVGITRPAMQAVAHLGGKEGLRKYLETGGRYNPKDAFGTSLSDYANEHRLAGGPLREQPTLGGMYGSASGADPENPNFRRALASKYSPLYAFADLMTAASGDMTNMLPDIVDDVQGIKAEAARMVNPELRMPDSVPQTGNVKYDMGEQVGGTRQRAPSAPQPTSEPDDDSEPSKPRFFDTAIDSLFGFDKIEDPDERKAKRGDVLQALSLGLSQMSGGSNVNLSPVFDRMSARQAEAAALAQQQQEAAIDNQMRAMDLAIKEGNLQVSQQNAAIAKAKFAQELDPTVGAPFSDAQLQAISRDPELQPYMQGLFAPDKAVRTEATKRIYDVFSERREAAEELGPQLGNLYDAINNNDQDAIVDILNSGRVEPEDLRAVYGLAGQDTSFLKNSKAMQWALDNDPNLARVMERIMMSQSPTGLDTEGQLDRDYILQRQSQFDQTLSTRGQILAQIDQIEDGTLNIMSNPDAADKGAYAEYFTNGYQFVSSVFGSDAAEFVADVAGLDVTEQERISNGASMLALMVARPLMEGQGTVTEGERTALLKTIASQELTPETRLLVISKLRALDAIDTAHRKMFSKYTVDNVKGARDYDRQVAEEAAVVAGPISVAAQNLTRFIHADKSDKFRQLSETAVNDPSAYFEQAAPLLTSAQFNMFKDAVPNIASPNGEGMAKIWRRRNEDGSVSYMVYRNGTSEEVIMEGE